MYMKKHICTYICTSNINKYIRAVMLLPPPQPPPRRDAHHSPVFSSWIRSFSLYDFSSLFFFLIVVCILCDMYVRVFVCKCECLSYLNVSSAVWPTFSILRTHDIWFCIKFSTNLYVHILVCTSNEDCFILFLIVMFVYLV